MRISESSDLHYGYSQKTHRKIEKAFKANLEFDPEVFLLAGDIPSHSLTQLDKFFNLFRKYYDCKALYVTGNHCLTSDCEILTKNGWKNKFNIDNNDVVATMDSNRNLEWNNITKIIDRPLNSEEKVYIYDTSVMSIGVTEHHRMYTHDRKNGKIKVVKANELWSDFSIINSVNSSSYHNISNELLKISAWMCTDSNFGKWGNITFYQRKSNVHKITDLLNSLGIEYKYRERNRNITEICGKKLKSCEIGCELSLNKDESKRLIELTDVHSNKELPSWAINLSNEQWDLFLNTLIEADGTLNKNSDINGVFYGRREICEDVQICAVTHGWRGNLKEYRKNHWKVNLSKKTETRVLNFDKCASKYNDNVWCISVENGNFLTRRNNKVYLTGNCLWSNSDPNKQQSFETHMSILHEILEDYDIHYIENNPIKINDVNFLGWNGWYKNIPHTNDSSWIQVSSFGGEELFHREITKVANTAFNTMLHEITPNEKTVVMTHHNIVGISDEYPYSTMNGDDRMAQPLIDSNVDYVFFGHSHQAYDKIHGDTRFINCGSDYDKPIIVNLEI